MSNDAATFDDLESDSAVGSEARPTSPIWTLELNPEKEGYNEKKLLGWLKAELDFLQKANEDRYEQIKRNLQLYKGLQYLSQTSRTDTRDKNVRSAVEKIVINELWNLTQNKVSRLVKYKPAISVVPHDDDSEDRIAAKANDALIRHIWYVQNYEDNVERTVARNSKVMGEAFLWIEWDPERGDLHPAAQRLAEKAKVTDVAEDANEASTGVDPEPPTLTDEAGNEVKDSNGRPLKLNLKKRVGDVGYTLGTPFTSVLQDTARIEDAEYCFKIEHMHIDRAKRKYPDIANEMKAQTVLIYDFEKMEMVSKANHVSIVHFYHKVISELEEGRYIVFCPDKIAGNTVYPYSHKEKGIGNVELPFERLTDEDFPEELPGRSFLERVKGLTGTVNNLTNLILRNQILVSHPKWMLPQGSANIAELGNDITVVRYRGAIAPVLVQAQPTPREVFEFRDILKNEAREQAGFGMISQGTPPPGIKAFVALQYLGENENDRANEEILKFNSFRRNVAVKSLNCAGDYYDPNDKRMIRMLGKSKAWMRVPYDASNLSRGYSVQIANSSALPQERAARNQMLVELKKDFPFVVSDEEFVDLLGLSQSDKFIDIATLAVQSAEMENDSLMDDKEVAAPEEWEGLIQHWKVHTRTVQEYRFKHFTKKEVQERVKDHLRATEMLMAEKSRLNPGFKKLVEQLPMFPLFYLDETIAEPSPEEEMNAEVQPGMLPPPGEGTELPDPAIFNEPQLPMNPDNPGAAPQSQVGPNGSPPEANLAEETVGEPALV